jgi:hypothetical protein
VRLLLIREFMKNNDLCSGCGQKDTCRSAYEKLGKAGGPNVAVKVIIAFLVPIGVSVGALVAGERLLQGRLEGKALTLVNFVMAVSLTMLAVCVIRAFGGPVKKEHGEKR